MKRRAIAFLLVSTLGLPAAQGSGIAVVDISALGQRAGHEFLNLTEYVYTAESSLNTQINTAKQTINSAEQLFRMGNAAYLKSLVGSTEIGQLYGQSQQLYQEINQLPHSFNPQNFQNDFNNTLSSWNQPNWTGYTTYSGYRVQPRAVNYQFETAITNGVDKVLGLLGNVQHGQEKWLNTRDEARQALDQSGDDAQTRKNGFALLDNDAAIAHTDQKAAQVYYQSQLVQQKVQAAQRIAQKAQAERNLSEAQQAADQELAVLPSTGFHETTHWNN